jgi:hypothetical protein
MGLDVYLFKLDEDVIDVDPESPGDGIEIASKHYPDHLFKIGYFRSSYNSGGFNSRMSKLGLPDLYWIFGAENGDTSVPDWHQALERILLMLGTLSDMVYGKDGVYDVDTVILNGAERDKYEALDIFKSEMGKSGPFRSYSSQHGEFFLDGMEIFAIIPGKEFQWNCAHLIYKLSEESLKWYMQALEIVRETIEYVIDTGEEGRYALSWSG